MTAVMQYIFLNIWIPCWGPHEIDWFASDHNHRLPVFYSRYWNVHSMDIDAFTVNWQVINGWYVPPVCLLLKVLMYTCSSARHMVLLFYLCGDRRITGRFYVPKEIDLLTR